ncbi:MAG: glutamate--tRNA ligase, partial [Gammaproteobacteria bacterium]
MIRTRFAPSPTGRLHLGNARTALFNALYAAHSGGRFVLRIEDTDAARNRAEHDAALLEDLRWLGLDWAEGPDCGGGFGPYRQSERGPIYRRYLDRLVAEDRAYPCFCSADELSAQRERARTEGRAPRYDGTCARLASAEVKRRLAAGEPAALRFRVPEDEIVFDDLVHGEQRATGSDIGDFVIRRTDGSPAFFFANALDDALMEITHVLRGEDHLANTPRQILILEALGLAAPRYGHLPLVLGTDDQPLSKRSGSASVAELREAGILSNALANYLLRLGHTTTNNELLGAEELERAFDPARLGHSPAHYDPAQLRHWQRLAVHGLNPVEARRWAGDTAMPEERWSDFWDLVRGNVARREDVVAWAETLTNLPEAEALAGAPVELVEAAVELSPEEDYGRFVRELRERTGLGGRKLFQPLRAALTGRHDGPEL